MVRDSGGLAARLRAIPATRVYGTIELASMALAGTAAAHLAWTIATPIGAYGDWRAAPAPDFDAARDLSLLTRFDPFHRGAAAGDGASVATALPLKLFGTSLNTAMGTGSAIIDVDGVQSSFAAGDEVMEGVTLKSVAFDHVVLTRGGLDELLYVDQSVPAETVAPEGTPQAEGAAAGEGGLTIDAVAASIRATPRIQNGQTTGLVVSAADPAQLSAAGLQDGDIVTRVNGESVTSIPELLERAAMPRADGMAIFTIERGGQVRTVRARIAR